jgi:hypothetical protein
MSSNANVHSIVLALLLIAFIPSAVFSTDGQIKIAQTSSTTFPIIINQAGSYVLTSNLVVTDHGANGIEITVNDVTIDLNGHSIQGPATGGIGGGINASDRYNLTIRNGRIWGFGTQGISLLNSIPGGQKGAGHVIEGVQVINNYEGIVVSGGVVSNCVANNNKINAGIWAINSLVTNCIANKNIGSGIIAENSIVINNTTLYNDYGIQAVDESFIKGNNLRNNIKGLVISGYRNYATQNVASDNGSGPADNFHNFNPGPNNYMPLSNDNANYGF